MLWHDGRGDYMFVDSVGDCADCRGGGKRKSAAALEDSAIYRCTSCMLGELTCGDCMRRRHLRTPFHTIEVSTFD